MGLEGRRGEGRGEGGGDLNLLTGNQCTTSDQSSSDMCKVVLTQQCLLMPTLYEVSPILKNMTNMTNMGQFKG